MLLRVKEHHRAAPPAKMAGLTGGVLVALLSAAGCHAGGSGSASYDRTVFISSDAMVPTLISGDQVGVNSTGKIERGAIVIFRAPPSWVDAPAGSTPSPPLEFVKRVIGVGGDHVVCCDSNGRITINGKAIREPYLPADATPSDTPFDVVVPQGRLWVMGDNRPGSADSRAHTSDDSHGTIPTTAVTGVVVSITSPAKRARVLKLPHYGL